MKQLIELVRRNWLFFLVVTAAALALRLLFVFRFPHLAGDTWIYGDIAKTWLNHGVFGLTDNGIVRPTLIRLPGYPGFLAAMFRIFGQDHYRAVMIAQALIDTNTCLVIAALALELKNARAAKAAYLLAALCPFTAMYTAAPLSETLAICCTAHALYYGTRGLKALQPGSPTRAGFARVGVEGGERALLLWAIAGLWAAAAIYIRPDDGIILPAMGLAFIVMLFRSPRKQTLILGAAVYFVAALAPLAPWTVRNWRVFHVFQPLASRYADDPGEFVPMGFNHWMKTWVVDFVSTEEVYWKVPGEPVAPNALPERAFDTWPEYQKTQQLIAQYNATLDIDPTLDHEFELLAIERMEHNPLRYDIWLPVMRMADMWLRPRTELLNVETRWWEFDQHPAESWFALIWAGVNLFYVVAAFVGWTKNRLGVAGVLLIGFIIARTFFLSTLENPEPRYVLECFPVVLALGGLAFASRDRKSHPADSPAIS